MNDISLVGLDKARLLAALYNASRPIGIGFLWYDPEPMSEAEAAELLKRGRGTWVEYLKGRVIKIDLAQTAWSPKGYDEINGQGAAQKVIEELRKNSRYRAKSVD